MKKYVQTPLLLVGTVLLLHFPAHADNSISPARTETITNTIGMEFILIKPGSFQMGASKQEDGAAKERPRHKVTLTQPFYMGKYEVTQQQWQMVMGYNHSLSKGPTNPINGVSWDDAQRFISRLNEREKTNSYHLPSEAQWEYAARAGSRTSYCYGDDPKGKKLARYGWYAENSNNGIHPVGELQPNKWGLHDMHGNVQEWVQDWYYKKHYTKNAEVDPGGPEKGTKRSIRGGSWINPAWHCRTAARNYYSADYVDSDIGFRLIKTP